MRDIDILMATYNGARYIKQQILSIISQTYSNWRLIIHDDGSTDDTINIIKSFCDLDERIILIEDGKTFKQPGAHFIYLLSFVESPYVCFCDQDDIWFENKLEVMLGTISSKDPFVPSVVFSDAYLYYLHNSITGTIISVRPRQLKDILFTNGGIHGSASIFNKKMSEVLLRNFEYNIMHDHILTLIACSFGNIDFIDDKLFLYRQHNNNVTGNVAPNKITRVYKAFSGLKNKYVLSCDTINTIKVFYNVYNEYLSHDDRQLLDKYFKTINLRGLKRIVSIIINGYSICNSKIHLLIKVLTRKFLDNA